MSEDNKNSEEYIIDLSGAFQTPMKKRGSSDDPFYEPDPNFIDPDNLPVEYRPGPSLDTENYNGRYEFLRKASTQIAIDPFQYGVGPNDLIEPPYDMYQLVNLNEISYVRNSCITAIARNTVGLGYRIKKVDPNTELFDSDDISEEIKKLLEKWASRDEKTFTELMYAVKYDEETTGNGYIEVSRNLRGEIDGLYHVPSHTIRLRGDRTGYVQERSTSKVPFYKFGDKVKILDNGEIKYLPDRDPEINELIHFKLYSPRNLYYGIPRDVGVFVTIAGDEMARNHNVKFFTHSAVPDLLLIFEIDYNSLPSWVGDAPVKVEIPDELRYQVFEHFRRSLSSQNFEPGLFYLPMGIKLRVERISQGQKDSGWTKYRAENRSEIRMAFGVPPIVIGDVSSGGYATVVTEKALFQEQMVGPEQVRYQQRLMGILWPEMVMIKSIQGPPVVTEEGDLEHSILVDASPRGSGAGVDPETWFLEFNQMKITDQASSAQMHNIYGSLGVLDVNEIRQDIGKKPKENAPQKTEEGPGSQPPNPDDIRGLQGGGRSENGAMNIPMPRRVGEDGVPTPPNILSVGNPGSDVVAGDQVDKRGEYTPKDLEVITNIDEALKKASQGLESYISQISSDKNYESGPDYVEED